MIAVYHTAALLPAGGCWMVAARFRGSENALSLEPELKVEVTFLCDNVDITVDAIKRIHPYEVPVINVIPLYKMSELLIISETIPR